MVANDASILVVGLVPDLPLQHLLALYLTWNDPTKVQDAIAEQNNAVVVVSTLVFGTVVDTLLSLPTFCDDRETHYLQHDVMFSILLVGCVKLLSSNSVCNIPCYERSGHTAVRSS